MKNTRRHGPPGFRPLILALAVLVAVATGCSGGGNGGIATEASAGSSPAPTETSSGQVSSTDPAVPSDEATTASSPAAPGSSAAATDNPSERAACLADTKPFTGPAVEDFGADKVADAYCTYSTLATGWAYQDDLIRKSEDQATEADFADVRPYMVASTAKAWDTAVKKARAGDQDAQSDVAAIKWFNVINGSPYAFEDTPAFRSVKVSDVKTTVDTSQPRPRLMLTMTISALSDLVEIKTQKPFGIVLSKDMTLYLEPTETADAQWSIGGWYASFDIGKPIPRKG